MSEPTIQTVKRLFAHSGNRCAFPKCPVSLTDEYGTKGKICHIRGENRTSARYDDSQTDEQRREYANLILMCGTHHDVIDQDEESYTVERLFKMKAAHETAMGSLPDAEAERGAAQLLSAQTIVTTVNQSGGIAAGAVYITNPAPPNPKTADAVERIWNAMLVLSTECSDVLLAEMILTSEEIDEHFKRDDWNGTFGSINAYSSEYTLQAKMERAGSNRLDPLSIHVHAELWRCFSLHRALVGRLAVLYQLSFDRGAYQDWRTDGLFQRTAIAVSGEEGWTRAVGMIVGGPQLLINATQEYFMKRVAQ